jgi:hypothetical protein
MSKKLDVLRDWNKSVKELETDFNVNMFHAEGVKIAMIGEINKAIESGMFSFLFGKKLKISPLKVAGVNLLYKCKIKPEKKGSLFFLGIKPYHRSNIPKSLFINGENLETGRRASNSTDNISPNGIKKIAEEMKKSLMI